MEACVKENAPGANRGAVESQTPEKHNAPLRRSKTGRQHDGENSWVIGSRYDVPTIESEHPVGGCWYWTAVDTVDTALEALAYAAYLSEKRGMTARAIGAFVECCAEFHGWGVNDAVSVLAETAVVSGSSSESTRPRK